MDILMLDFGPIIDSERYVIACCLLDNRLFPVARDRLSVNRFFRESHGEMWGEMEALWEADVPLFEARLGPDFLDGMKIEDIDEQRFRESIARLVEFSIRRDIGSRAVNLMRWSNDMSMPLDSVFDEAIFLGEACLAWRAEP